jgi:hypothetical protein
MILPEVCRLTECRKSSRDTVGTGGVIGDWAVRRGDERVDSPRFDLFVAANGAICHK